MGESKNELNRMNKNHHGCEEKKYGRKRKGIIGGEDHQHLLGSK
jgi:hypothetical protein